MTTTIPPATDNSALQDAANRHLFVGMTNAAQLAEEGGPLVMDSADGVYVTAMDGKKYIDGISGMYFRNAGHGGINIVYRRRDGNIGWIDPSLAKNQDGDA